MKLKADSTNKPHRGKKIDPNKHTLSMKVKIVGSENYKNEDKECKELYTKLAEINTICCKIKNYNIRQLYFSDMGFAYPELKTKYPELNSEFYNERNRLIYKEVRDEYPTINPSIVSQILVQSRKVYRQFKYDMFNLTANMPSFNKDKSHISIGNQCYEIGKDPDDKLWISLYLEPQTENTTRFKLYLDRIKNDAYKQRLLDIIDKKIFKGNLDIMPVDGSWFVRICFDVLKEKNLTKNKIAGLDLGERIFGSLVITDIDSIKNCVGSQLYASNYYAPDIMACKSKIRALRRKHQHIGGIDDVRQGHGLSRKLLSINKLCKTEDNRIESILHKISKDIVNKCVVEGVSIFVLENLKGMQKLKDIKALGRLPYRKFQIMLGYKLISKGIACYFVSPYNTSKTCCRCDYIYSEFNHAYRVANKMPPFICPKCGFKMDADNNAAINIIKTYLNNKDKKDKMTVLTYEQWLKSSEDVAIEKKNDKIKEEENKVNKPILNKQEENISELV